MYQIRLVLAVLVTSCVACAPSLESAHLRTAEQSAAPAAPRDGDHCRMLSNAERALRYVSVGAGVLGGGSGLATIPVEERSVDYALAVSGATLAVGAITVEAIRAEVAADWARECQ